MIRRLSGQWKVIKRPSIRGVVGVQDANIRGGNKYGVRLLAESTSSSHGSRLITIFGAKAPYHSATPATPATSDSQISEAL
jgi:hypothetical protein